MKRSRHTQHTPSNLTRREFLTLAMGGVGTVLTCACGGVLGAYLLTHRRKEIEVAALAAPAAPTSAVNRNNYTKVMAKPPIVARADWGALPPDHEAENENGYFDDATNIEGWRVYAGDLRDTYRTMVVHHSVEDDGDDITTLLGIQQLHRVDRGWADVAYHFFIGKTGTVYEGRELDVRGTHVAGYNTGSVGVCFLGNYMLLAPTAEQLASAASLAAWLAVRLQLTHVAGHREFNSETVCPGDNLEILVPQIAEAAGLQLGTAGYSGPTPAAQSTETSFVPSCPCHL